MGYINKTVFLNYIDCPTLGWMTKRNLVPRDKDLSNDLLIYEGKYIHKLSWQLFPDAINAQKSEIISSYENTKQIIQENNKTILEASFISDGFSTRIDILRKEDSGWHLYEVKSGSKYKSKYACDMAFSAMVLAKSEIEIEKTTLMYLSKDYRLGMGIDKLFTFLDCTEKVMARKDGYESISQKAFEDLESDLMPEPYLKRSCKNCPLFEQCMGKGIKNHIFDLPRLSAPSMEELISLGADTIDKIPDDFELTEAQKIVKDCVINNKTYISENLKVELENIKKPYYYLDFESMTTIMPLYPGIAPHTQILTQFSIDKSDILGEITEHFEYIADHMKDCRRELAEKLIEYLGDSGSIITYSNFERIGIGKLSALFPDLSEKLNILISRIVDFEVLVRKNYYDIGFQGKSTIKKILPIMIPDMSYEELEIGEGGDAAAAFAFMAMGNYDNEKIEETKKNLLKYCAQDTYAMLRIHKFLVEAVNDRYKDQ